MTFDRPLYVVILNHPNGPYVSETDLSRMNLVNVSKDLRDGQYGDDVLAVIELNLATHYCRDATHDFQALLDRSPDDA